MKNIDKNFLLKDSKTFCMFPWLHLYVTPKGNVYPCCSNNYSAPFGNTKTDKLKDIFNSEEMKELRLNMLNNVPSKICEFCYKHEESSPYSFRTYSMDHYKQYFDELIPNTEEDGTVPEFKMRYFDIRFSNICNFKCRTCGNEFSSQWAKESRKYNKEIPILWHANDGKTDLLDEVLEHVDHVDLAYFAGGEPLITDEHYIILEEMIRKNKTNITLRYNTNASNIKYKKHDILSLWKHFKKVELSCSIDHYGERAEWLRHGTDWGKVEENLLIFRDLNYIDFQINTVFSIFNYYTISEFYSYMQSKNLVRNYDWYHSLYLAMHPTHYNAKSMPIELKLEAEKKAKKFIKKNKGNLLERLVSEAVNFASGSNTWNENKKEFWRRTDGIDSLRKEDFLKIFPELSKLRILEE